VLAGVEVPVAAIKGVQRIVRAAFADAQNLVWGPYLELHLPGGNSVEIDALRRKYDFGTVGTTSSWEFPVVLKHRIGEGMVRPYFEGGAAFSRLSDISLSTLKHRQNYGHVVGGGVEIKFLFLKLSPEVRYTAWAVKNFDGTLQTNRNQLAVLTGFGF
jgi:hypothetical protein